jgi:plasmid stabilization system protein ParE
VRLILSRQARADLAEIRRYLAQDNPRVAAAELARIDAIIQRLASGELQGPEIRLPNGQRMRGWPVPPYRVYYERTASLIRIVRVYHGARRPIE